jgi:drug/metabolite transporter (DMT)-like permease
MPEARLSLARTAGVQLFTLTVVAMLAFAANSVLCRLALKNTSIDAATFTTLRLVAGAVMLALLVSLRTGNRNLGGNWTSTLALFAYAVTFSFAYIGLSAGTGALLLFAAVQTTMIVYTMLHGERLRPIQWLGFTLSLAGLVVLVLPGISAPPLTSAVLMLCAGISWGAYSLRGRGCVDPAGDTAGNFVRCVPLSLAASVVFWSSAHFDNLGALYAVLSGAIASGLGYVIWYTALRGLSGTKAAVVQLSVPVIAAFGGILFLGESMTLRLILACVAILGGIGLVVLERR